MKFNESFYMTMDSVEHAQECIGKLKELGCTYLGAYDVKNYPNLIVDGNYIRLVSKTATALESKTKVSDVEFFYASLHKISGPYYPLSNGDYNSYCFISKVLPSNPPFITYDFLCKTTDGSLLLCCTKSLTRIDDSKTVQLSNNTAKVSKDGITVGCTTINADEVNKLWETFKSLQ